MPEIYVKVSNPMFAISGHAKARIRIRKGCYQYLVWRDGAETKEFYLGKKETHTPQPARARAAAAIAGAGRPRAAVRGKK